MTHTDARWYGDDTDRYNAWCEDYNMALVCEDAEQMGNDHRDAGLPWHKAHIQHSQRASRNRPAFPLPAPWPRSP